LDQVIGRPGWLGTQWYDIADADQSQMLPMPQSLLADRFQLKLPVYLIESIERPSGD
jgi:uncharacterized protein (TIGR03435 family)